MSDDVMASSFDDAFVNKTIDRLDSMMGALETVWTLSSSFFVFVMQVGFAFLEAGSVRSVNVITITFKNLADCAIGGVLWWMLGRYIAGLHSGSLGGFIGDFAEGTYGASDLLMYMYITTGMTIISGALAERVAIKGYYVLVILSCAVVFPVVVHWVWSKEGWLAKFGVVDFAGSLTIHASGGTLAAVCAWVLGPRELPGGVSPFTAQGRAATTPHNKFLQVVGTMVLWFGWFGFNAGSVTSIVSSMKNAEVAAVSTALSGASAVVTALAVLHWQSPYLDCSELCNSLLAGLVSVTASCGFITGPVAIGIGVAGSLIYLGSSKVISWMKLDDVVGAVSVHGVCGVFGTLCVALADEEYFRIHVADPTYSLDRLHVLKVQLVGIVCVIAWCLAWGYVMVTVIRLCGILRVSREHELEGCDGRFFGCHGYDYIGEVMTELQVEQGGGDESEAEEDVERPSTGDGGEFETMQLLGVQMTPRRPGRFQLLKFDKFLERTANRVTRFSDLSNTDTMQTTSPALSAMDDGPRPNTTQPTDGVRSGWPPLPNPLEPSSAAESQRGSQPSSSSCMMQDAQSQSRGTVLGSACSRMSRPSSLGHRAGKKSKPDEAESPAQRVLREGYSVAKRPSSASISKPQQAWRQGGPEGEGVWDAWSGGAPREAQGSWSDQGDAAMPESGAVELVSLSSSLPHGVNMDEVVSQRPPSASRPSSAQRPASGHCPMPPLRSLNSESEFETVDTNKDAAIPYPTQDRGEDVLIAPPSRGERRSVQSEMRTFEEQFFPKIGGVRPNSTGDVRSYVDEVSSKISISSAPAALAGGLTGGLWEQGFAVNGYQEVRGRPAFGSAPSGSELQVDVANGSCGEPNEPRSHTPTRAMPEASCFEYPMMPTPFPYATGPSIPVLMPRQAAVEDARVALREAVCVYMPTPAPLPTPGPIYDTAPHPMMNQMPDQMPAEDFAPPGRDEGQGKSSRASSDGPPPLKPLDIRCTNEACQGNEWQNMRCRGGKTVLKCVKCGRCKTFKSGCEALKQCCQEFRSAGGCTNDKCEFLHLHAKRVI